MTDNKRGEGEERCASAVLVPPPPVSVAFAREHERSPSRHWARKISCGATPEFPRGINEPRQRRQLV